MDRFTFRSLTQEQGLSQDAATAICQDGLGFIWIGTEEGLNRFDGRQFKLYRHDPDNPASLSGNWIQDLYADPHRDSVIWVSVRGGGLNRFDTATGEVFRYPLGGEKGLRDDRIMVILKAHDAIWAGTQRAGLTKLVGRDRFEHVTAAAQAKGMAAANWVQDMLVDSSGAFWLATTDGLQRYYPDSGRFETHIPNPALEATIENRYITALLESDDGLLLGSFGGGLYHFNRETGAFTSRLPTLDGPQPKVISLVRDRDGLLWVGSLRSGVFVLDPNTERVTHLKHDRDDPNSINHPLISFLYRDRADVIWVGTRAHGVNLLDPDTRGIGLYHKSADDWSSLVDNSITRVIEDHAGVLWLGTDGKGVDSLDRKAKVVRHHHAELGNGPGSDRINAIIEDRRHNLWVGSHAGLDRMGPERKSFETVTLSDDRGVVALPAVLSLLEDHKQRIWFGVNHGGLYRYDPDTGQYQQYRHTPNQSNGLTGNVVISLFQNDNHALWIGTTRGLNRLDHASGTVTNWRSGQDSGLMGDDVYAMHGDAAGRLWIGTSNGLNSLDPVSDRITRHGREFARIITGIESTPAGVLWLSTSRGVIRYHPDEDRFWAYNRDDGFQNSFHYGAHLRDSSGIIHFGGGMGLTSFDPERPRGKTYAPPLYLTNFYLFNQPVSPNIAGSPLTRPIEHTFALKLDHTQDMIDFEFAALDYAKAQKLRYRYRLRGFHKSWIHTDAHKRRVSFTGLPAGDYTLEVESIGEDDKPSGWTTLDLELEPPPWRSPAAYLLYLMLMIAGFLLLMKTIHDKFEHQRRLNRILQKEKALLAREVEAEKALMLYQEAEIRLLHAQMNPHFLQNALTNAIYFTDTDPEKAELVLTRLSHLLRLSFNATPKGSWPLSSELDLINDYLDIQRIRFEERLIAEVSSDPALKNHPTPCFLIQPLVENAVEHGFKQTFDALTVTLSCAATDGFLAVDVSNSGEPLNRPFETLLDGAHALGNINRRLDLLYGQSLTYEYVDGRHHFRLKIPLQNQD